MPLSQWLRKKFGSEVRDSRGSRRGKSQQSRRRHLLQLEPLEARLALASYVVTSTDDHGPGTLRQAITDSAANHQLFEPDTIQFSPTLDGQTINLTKFINDSTVAGPSAFAINNNDD